MSIQSEINRIAGAKSDIADAIEDMGGTLPSGATIDDMAAGVRSIPQGASDYTDLTNKPQINGVTLTGNKSLSDIGAASESDLEDLQDITGDGSLSGFTANDLTGAANELRNSLNSYVKPNLLDNWYFGNPVNQREQTSYSNAGYGIDRWKTTSTDNVITLNTSSISVKNNAASSRRSFDQQLPKILYGKTVTGSLLTAEGNIYYGTVTIPNTASGTETQLPFADFDGNTIRINVNVNGILSWQLMVKGNTTLNIQAVKLELGSEQTLAHQENGVWVLNEILDYGVELLKCQRYFQKFRTQSLRPTYGEDCRPVMAAATPIQGTITKDSITYYTLSAEP